MLLSFTRYSIVRLPCFPPNLFYLLLTHASFRLSRVDSIVRYVAGPTQRYVSMRSVYVRPVVSSSTAAAFAQVVVR